MADLDRGRLQGRGILVPAGGLGEPPHGQATPLQPRRAAAAAGRRRRAGRTPSRSRSVPRAATSCSSGSAGAPTITNDGVSIAREIELADQFENMGAQLVREVANKTSDLTGDGTTTATLLAQAIVREGMRALDDGANPMLLRRGIEEATELVVAERCAARAAGRRAARAAARGDDRRQGGRGHRRGGRRGARPRRRRGRGRRSRSPSCPASPSSSARACSSRTAGCRPTWSPTARMETVIEDPLDPHDHQADLPPPRTSPRSTW